MTNFFKGAATALVTPFTDNGINFEEFGKQIEFQIANGVDALVILGTTGEPATMTEEEKTELMRYSADKIAGRVKVIFGTGSNDTAKAVAASKHAQTLGADGVLCVTPYYNKCTQRGLFEYYKTICDSVSIPVIAYNVPSRTGVNILPETCANLAEIHNIAGIKDACGNMAQTVETMRLIRGKTDLFSGEDALNLPILAIGAAGVISVVSNVAPLQIKKMCEYALNNDVASAALINDKLIPLIKACFTEVNPIPIKAALKIMGFNMGLPRSPLTEAEESTKQLLKKSLCELEIIK